MSIAIKIVDSALRGKYLTTVMSFCFVLNCRDWEGWGHWDHVPFRCQMSHWKRSDVTMSRCCLVTWRCSMSLTNAVVSTWAISLKGTLFLLCFLSISVSGICILSSFHPYLLLTWPKFRPLIWQLFLGVTVVGSKGWGHTECYIVLIMLTLILIAW